jgi:hypothetical protein
MVKKGVIGTPLKIKQGLSSRLSEADLTIKEVDLIKRLTQWQSQSRRRNFFIGIKAKKVTCAAKS